MQPQTAKPIRGREAINDCDGAQVEQPWRDGRILGGNEDSSPEVALETYGRKEGVGEIACFGCVLPNR